MGLQLVTPPAAEPLSLAEAKLHCRISQTSEDALVSALIIASRQYVEQWTGRQLVACTWLYTQDSFYAQDLTARRPPATPYGNYPTAGFWPRLTGYVYGVPANSAIRLPKSPLQSISQLQYVDGNGTLQTLAASNYTLTALREPGLLIPAYGVTWPVTQIGLDCVQVTFTAGWPHTTAAGNISAGANQIVTPASMAGIGTQTGCPHGNVLCVDPGANQEWVQVTAATATTFTATFAQNHSAGCLITAVPLTLRQAMLLTVSHWYEHREAVAEGGMAEVPLAAKALMMSEWTGEYVPGPA